MGEDVGTPNPRKNGEVAADTESNAYNVWVGNDQGVYMSRSMDSGNTWDQTSIRVSPVEEPVPHHRRVRSHIPPQLPTLQRLPLLGNPRWIHVSRIWYNQK